MRVAANAAAICVLRCYVLLRKCWLIYIKDEAMRARSNVTIQKPVAAAALEHD
jgi:hypothetical protein